MFTERLELRPTEERDRGWFVSAFADPGFMVYSGGVLDEQAANRRFDEMKLRSEQFRFGKQPVVERTTGSTLGYCGINLFDFEGATHMEIGWRLTPDARGKGYATEAASAILAIARDDVSQIYALIDPRNEPSKRVAHKVGFEFRKRAVVMGYLDNIYMWTP